MSHFAPIAGGQHTAEKDHRWLILVIVAIAQLMVILDSTVVNIALPAMKRSLHAEVGTLQWIVSGYTLTLAAFLLAGGSLGDRFGRRKLFVIGVAWFAAASALCGVAPNAGVLVAARVLQGIGGALLAPASLAIIQASFRPDDRARAIGAWSGLGGLATAAGPLVGGYLLAVASWRWVFYINLPMAVTVVVVAVRHVPESSDPTISGPVDRLGAALGVVVLSGLSYGLIEGANLGWASPAIVASLLAAGLGAVAFWFVERRAADPQLPLQLFRVRQLSAANAVTFLMYAALSGALFLLPTELQLVQRYSALESGLSLLPVTVIMLVLSPRSARLAARIGPRLQMSAGPLLAGLGLVLLTRAAGGGDYATDVLPAVIVFGLGLAVCVAPLTATAIGASPADHAGVASAINNVVARSAGLIAVAVLPVVAGITGAGALDPGPFAHGFRIAMVVAGCGCAAAGILASVTIRNRSA
jgi:EmrB/QacA subfamily drug resistance transporter